jgi:hypothetical protein
MAIGLAVYRMLFSANPGFLTHSVQIPINYMERKYS